MTALHKTSQILETEVSLAWVEVSILSSISIQPLVSERRLFFVHDASVDLLKHGYGMALILRHPGHKLYCQQLNSLLVALHFHADVDLRHQNDSSHQLEYLAQRFSVQTCHTHNQMIDADQLSCKMSSLLCWDCLPPSRHVRGYCQIKQQICLNCARKHVILK